MCFLDSKYLGFVAAMTSFVILSEGFEGHERNARFFKLENSLDGDIGIDLDFTIPFIKIPIKKTMESFGSEIIFPTINVNIVGLALGGIAILGSAFLLPFLTKSFGESDDRYGRLLDQANFGAHEMLAFSSKLFERDGSIKDCSLRIACLAAKKSTNSDSINTLQQISRNGLLSRILNMTAIDEALRAGWRGRACTQACPFTDEQINSLLSNMAGL